MKILRKSRIEGRKTRQQVQRKYVCSRIVGTFYKRKLKERIYICFDVTKTAKKEK